MTSKTKVSSKRKQKHYGEKPYQRTRATALSIGQRLLIKHGLDEWQVDMDRAKTRAGGTHYDKKLITVAEEFARKVPCTQLKGVFLHEIAHALVGFAHGHDKIWKQKVVEIGGSVDVEHNVAFVKAKYTCQCGDIVFERHRAMSTRSRCKNTAKRPICIKQI